MADDNDAMTRFDVIDKLLSQSDAASTVVATIKQYRNDGELVSRLCVLLSAATRESPVARQHRLDCVEAGVIKALKDSLKYLSGDVGVAKSIRSLLESLSGKESHQVVPRQKSI